MTPKNPQRGFTLIELVIVIGILGILMGVVISVLNPALYQKKARDVVRKNHINEIAKAAMSFYAESGSWPTCTELKNTYTPQYPNSDPKVAPNQYYITSCGTGSFRVEVGQEVYPDKCIWWSDSTGKITENGTCVGEVAGCKCT